MSVQNASIVPGTGARAEAAFCHLPVEMVHHWGAVIFAFAFFPFSMENRRVLHLSLSYSRVSLIEWWVLILMRYLLDFLIAALLTEYFVKKWICIIVQLCFQVRKVLKMLFCSWLSVRASKFLHTSIMPILFDKMYVSMSLKWWVLKQNGMLFFSLVLYTQLNNLCRILYVIHQVFYPNSIHASSSVRNYLQINLHFER